MTAKIRNKNDISKKWKRNILSSLEKEAPTVSPLGYKKAASLLMPLSLSCLEQAAGYLGVVATEQTWTSDRNILEVGKPEDVQR